MFVQLSLILSVLIASFVSSYYLRKETFSDVPPVIQPKDIAFSIWSLIFVTGILRAALSVTQSLDAFQLLSLLFHTFAFCSCAAWAPVFSVQRLRLACALITLATVFAFSSLLLASINSWYDLLVHSGVDLLAGWLSVALSLSLVLAGLAPDSTAVLLLFTTGLSFTAVLVSRPLLLLPLLWALLLQNVYDNNIRLSVSVITLGLVSSFLSRSASNRDSRPYSQR